MKLKNIFMVALSVMALSSCQKQGLMDYEGTDYIYFGASEEYLYSGESYMLTDTVKTHSFIYHEKQDTVITFDLYVTGGVRDYDRPYTVEQLVVTEDGYQTAVAGVNFAGFDSAEMSGEYVLKAGECHIQMPIKIYRPTSESDKYVVAFQLKSNDYFEANESYPLWRKVKFSSTLEEPYYWSTRYYTYFGDYSYEKHLFMTSQTGYTWDDEYFDNLAMDMYSYWNYRLTDMLEEYNAESIANGGDVLRDSAGNAIEFPLV